MFTQLRDNAMNSPDDNNIKLFSFPARMRTSATDSVHVVAKNDSPVIPRQCQSDSTSVFFPMMCLDACPSAYS